MLITEIEKYWLNSSEDSFDTAEKLFVNEKYVHSMFFLHLAIEKILKSLYVNRNNAEALFGHNLLTIASKIDEVQFEPEMLETLSKITTFNIASRYDDYKNNFYKICDRKFAEEYLLTAKETIRWIKSQFK